MRAVSAVLGVAAALGLWAGCGGGNDRPAAGTPPPEAARPAARPAARVAAQAGAPAPAADTEAPQAGRETELVRETYAYRGSGRDPFISLLRSGDVRPLLEDLRVVNITFNPRYPGSSVAVLREAGGRRYTVRVGDELGRLRIAEIRPYEVVVIVEEFGTERQTVLRLRRLQEGMP